MPSYHNRVSIFWLLCNMLSCSVQDISRSRLSKVDGICSGYSSHHLCGKVHRHDQQSILSNKLPRLSLSWVIKSFSSSSSLWNRNEKQWDFPATPYNLSIFSNNQLECFLWNNLSRYWIKSLIVERNFRKNAPSNDEEEVNFSFHIVSNLVLVSRLSGFDHCPCGNSDTTASVPKYGLFLVFNYFTKQNFLFRALSGLGSPHIGWGLGGGLPENFAPFHQVLWSLNFKSGPH